MKKADKEKTCKSCLHYKACLKWSDFPKQCGVPTCRHFCEDKKSAVAREIFAEINRLLFFNMNEQHYEGDRLVEMNFSGSLEDDITALEKKYTKGGTE